MLPKLQGLTIQKMTIVFAGSLHCKQGLFHRVYLSFGPKLIMKKKKKKKKIFFFAILSPKYMPKHKPHVKYYS